MIKQLKPFFQTLEDQEKESKKCFRKLKALKKWILQNFPSNIEGSYSFSDIGSTCIRCFIYLDKADIESTINLCKWLPKLKATGWKITKFWRDESGYFAYRADREFNNCISYILIFEDTANIDGCVITKKEVTKTVYVTDCEPEQINL